MYQLPSALVPHPHPSGGVPQPSRVINCCWAVTQKGTMLFQQYCSHRATALESKNELCSGRPQRRVYSSLTATHADQYPLLPFIYPVLSVPSASALCGKSLVDFRTRKNTDTGDKHHGCTPQPARWHTHVVPIIESNPPSTTPRGPRGSICYSRVDLALAAASPEYTMLL